MAPTSDNNSQNEIYDFPYSIVDIDDELFKKASAQLHELSDKKGVVVGPKKYILPEMYKKCYTEIYNFQARPDDILLIGFPRSGTTVHSEMVWLIENGLDFEAAEKVILTHRFPLIDLCLSMGDLNVFKIVADNIKATEDIHDIAQGYSKLTINHLADCKERRFIRSHLPVSLISPSFFQKGSKVIYCARNPKDLVVSYYHVSQFLRPNESEMVSFKSFWNAFRNDWTMYSPYFEHLKEAWEKRNDDNFLFLFYEDTIKDLQLGVSKMASFLGKELTEEQVGKLVDYLGIDNFRKNKSVNCQHLCDLGIASNEVKFIREGKLGGWRKYFQGDLEVEVDSWVQENLKDSELCFP